MNVEIDPMAHVRVGDPADVNDILNRMDAIGCAAVSIKGYSCTRDPNHPGDHIATGPYTGVLDVWPVHPLEALARSIAVAAHEGQGDQAGEPYIGHVSRVVARLSDPFDRAAAWLHDVLEDTEWKLRGLIDAGDSEFQDKSLFQAWIDVIAVVRALTHQKHEARNLYYDRVKAAGPSAVRVKLADIADNADEARLSVLPQEKQDRLREKYRKAAQAFVGAER